MALLTSASTISQIIAAYDDNSAYDINNSVTEAGQFVQACRMLLTRRAQRSQFGGEETELPDLRHVADQLKTAMQFLSTNTQGGGVRHPILTDFRS